MSTIKVIIRDNKGNQRNLNVLLSDTINGVKSKLGNAENRNWMYNGMLLKGNKTFNDYGIEDGDMIMERVTEPNDCIKITIQDSSRNQKLINVSSTETIDEAKIKLGEGQGIWMYNGERLDANKTFKDYGIEDGDMIMSMNF